MAKTLVIVESPTKAKAIGKFLGSNYTVKSSMGHVRDLPKSQIGVDVDNNFQPKYINIRGKGELLKSLKASAKNVDKILLASDPDREGEMIAWHLREFYGIKEDKCRIEFNEITKDAVKAAVKSPREIDIDRVNSQQARRILDRLVGYKLSPLLWKKVKKGLSAGRVQSVAVRMICDREEDINAFIPEEYWSLKAYFPCENGKKVLETKLMKIGTKKADIPNEEAMNSILADLKTANYAVKSIVSKDKKRNPAPPFTTSSLQQEAARKLNFPAKRTMQVAQQLYEGIDLPGEGVVGLITYMRTDAVRVSTNAQEAARTLIASKYGAEFLPAKPPYYASKGKIQDAHEAVRPTSVMRVPANIKSYLTPQQFKLYKLIWERFVASQMMPATLLTTTIDVNANTTPDYIFRANGSIVKFAGFMQVYIEGKDEEDTDDMGLLPKVNEGEMLDIDKLDPAQHFTQPPARFTEASLVKALEEQGIGRPSTYAPIIDTIMGRGYVVKEEKSFYPTELGTVVVHLLKENFPDIIDLQFTANMEVSLDKIEEGELEWTKVLEDFYPPFALTLAEAEEKMAKVELTPEESGEFCPKCGKPLLIKMGRYGKFLACAGFPECRQTKAIVKETGVKCLACGGNIIERKSKGGRIFYGCNNYPECKYVSWDKPIDEKCETCGGQLAMKKVAGNKEGVKVCPNKDCETNEKVRKTPVKKAESAKKPTAKKPAAKKTTKKPATKKTTTKKPVAKAKVSE